MFHCKCGHKHLTFFGTFPGSDGQRFSPSCPQCDCADFRDGDGTRLDLFPAPTDAIRIVHTVDVQPGPHPVACRCGHTHATLVIGSDGKQYSYEDQCPDCKLPPCLHHIREERVS